MLPIKHSVTLVKPRLATLAQDMLDIEFDRAARNMRTYLAAEEVKMYANGCPILSDGPQRDDL